MTAYRRVYDLRHLQADCQEPGSAPKPYARATSMGYLAFLQTDWVGRFKFSSCAVNEAEQCGTLSAPLVRHIMLVSTTGPIF